MLRPPPPTSYSVTDHPRLPKPKFTLFRRPRKASRTLSTSSSPSVSLTRVQQALDDDQDQYRWAIVYENQRGLKIFSTLYYSFSSLLPTDPSPFTVPSSKRAKQPDVSLAVYPLPDGAWRWLSPWMIDMRSDSGEVQHDGFEYNFMFRTHKWHPEAGAMSWGGNTPITPSPSIIGVRNRYSVASSVPPSVAEEDSFDGFGADDVWLSDNSDINWEQCRLVMRRAGRDGRILELWRRWLGDTPPESQDRLGRRKQWTEDDALDAPSEPPIPVVAYTPPPIANIAPALRRHGDAILHSFIYPESRARFLEMLERAGVLGELNSDLGAVQSSSEVEFWSYLNEGGDHRIIAEDSTVQRRRNYGR
ncbi:hypothetical protein C8R46DRAFT_1090464 [Mycena filopes]|nr:hypothetical protein C8R46DRAFT_1090464 [Mycena filopes]